MFALELNSTTTFVPIETYLSTSYEADMDYVDGELEDRNGGGFDHNLAQKVILFWFDQHEWNGSSLHPGAADPN